MMGASFHTVEPPDIQGHFGNNGLHTWQWSCQLVSPGDIGAILIPEHLAMLLRAQWNHLAIYFSEQFPIIKNHVAVLAIHSVLCPEKCPPVSSFVHLTLKIFSLYFVFRNSVFLYIVLSVIIRNLSIFWLSLRHLPTHVATGKAQEFHHFITTLCPNGDSSHSHCLAQVVWTHEMCRMQWCQSAVTSAHSSCYFTTYSPSFWLPLKEPHLRGSQGNLPSPHTLVSVRRCTVGSIL